MTKKPVKIEDGKFSSYQPHYQYLCYVVRHKWFVFLESCKLGVPLLGLIHDWSKFKPSEWRPYVNFFHGKGAKQVRDETGYYKPNETGDSAFDFAFFLHQKRNKHHWQWWVYPQDETGVKILPMGDRSRREMLADWRGAGRAQGTPDCKKWYMKNGYKLQLHSDTRAWIEEQLGVKNKAECDDCKTDYEDLGLDIVFPASQWNMIKPDGYGILCGNCIAKRAAELPQAIAIRARIDFLDDPAED